MVMVAMGTMKKINAMFSFLKPKVPIPSSLQVDIHSHFIPAIDDGSQSMQESITLIKAMQDLGYKKVITTPHIMLDTYKNTPDIIHQGLNTVHQAMKENHLTIQLEVAAEYYLDDGFIPLLEKGNLLTVANKYLLFETSYISKPLQLEEMIFQILAKGYIPLMAHPERYRYIKNPQKEYTRLKDLGVMFQSNINALGGHYGKSAQNLIRFLSSQGMIDFLGSDAHRIKHINTLPAILNSKEYYALREKNTILNETLI